jgi:hypothetical protein
MFKYVLVLMGVQIPFTVLIGLPKEERTRKNMEMRTE